MANFRFEVTTVGDVFISSYAVPRTEINIGSYSMQLESMVGLSQENPPGWFHLVGGNYVFSMTVWVQPTQTSFVRLSLTDLAFSDNNGQDKYTIPFSKPMDTNLIFLRRDEVPELSSVILFAGIVGLWARRKV
jgi:hypothetical protein